MAKSCRSKEELAFMGTAGNKSPDRKPAFELGSKHELASSCPEESWQEWETRSRAESTDEECKACGKVGREQGESAGP